MSDNQEALSTVFTRLLRNTNALEETAVKRGPFENMTVNDIRVIEAIGPEGARNMSAVAKILMVTTGTLTISVNSLVKKGYVNRERSTMDRRVVLVSLTDMGKKAYHAHKSFQDAMITEAVSTLSEEEKQLLGKALESLNTFFRKQNERFKRE